MTALPMHGANFEALYASMGVDIPAGVKILDFSTNVNAVPWEGSWAFDTAALASTYPDPDCTKLRWIIARRESCSADNILVTNGSNEAVYLIASLFSGQAAFIHDPVYGEYRRACEAYGVSEAGHACDADIRFLCNPCNPTGGYVENGIIEAEAERNKRQTIVVDEAYRDFLKGSDKPIAFADLPNIIILRSLTKIFHLCGARIGYVLAPREWIRALKERQPVWSVNAFAQEACGRFLSDADFIARTRAFYGSNTPRFIADLEKIGLRVSQTRTNFFLIEVSDDRRTIAELLKRGIVVRHTRNFRGLDGRYIRVATRLPHENDRFIEAAKSLRSLYGELVF